jgi:hypothetical protein
LQAQFIFLDGCEEKEYTSFKQFSFALDYNHEVMQNTEAA